MTVSLTYPSFSRRSALQIAGGTATAVTLGITGCSPGEEPPNPFQGDDSLESPALKARVDAGDLPPLTDRLPIQPMVVQPVEGVGRHGGTLRHAQSADNLASLQTFASAGLLEQSREDGSPIASLVESFTVDDEARAYTLVLREGLKWSDGEPFGKDDVDFVLADVLGNSTLTPSPPYYYCDAEQQLPTHEWIDDRTVVITFGVATPLFPKYMAHPAVGLDMVAPRHYLEQFHPDFAGADEADAAARKAGFESWDLHFLDRSNPWTNPDLPVMGAYQVTTPTAGGGTATMERNPYYWKVDPDGRQLPYIDKVSVQILSQEALDLRAANGELDLQGYNLGFTSSQVLLENAESKGYAVHRWGNPGMASVTPNVSHQDPELRSIFADVRFRAALSHAINRADLNQALMGGLGMVRHPLEPEDGEYAVPGGGGTTFLDHDVEQANHLLDEMGMTRSGEWRTRPDGKAFEPVLIYDDRDDVVPLTDALQLMIADLAKVGIKIILKPVDPGLYGQLRNGNDYDLAAVAAAPMGFLDYAQVWWVPTAATSHTAPGYGQWYATNGKAGMEPSAEMQQLMDTWDRLRTARDEETRISAGQEIMAQHDENVYLIGLIGPPFLPVVVSDKLHNVREDEPVMAFQYGREGVTTTEQLWLEP